MIESGDREEEKPPEGEVGEEAWQEPRPEPYSPVWYDSTYDPWFEVLNPEDLSPQEPLGVRSSMERLDPTGPWGGYPGLAETAAERLERPRKGRWGVLVRELAETLLLAALIFLAVRASLQNFRVEGTSMLPSLQHGQYLIVNKLAYAEIDLKIFDWVPFFDPGEHSVHHLFGGPERGDIIVFRAPSTPERDFIKRIIGVPGDTVRIADGTVFVNDKPLEESYVQGQTTCSAGTSGCGPWTVPANAEESIAACHSSACYFVLGDNRQNSSDSRSFGFVPEQNIIGKAFFSYWPLDDAGLAPNHSVSFARQADAEE